LAEVLIVLFESPIAGRIEQPQHPDGRIDREAPDVGGGLQNFALEQIVDGHDGESEVGEEI
jgi:hypothetical protein